MLLRTDPFRDLDRLGQQKGRQGTAARPAVIAKGAGRESDSLVVEFDLPGVRPESLDIDVERNMLTVSAERHGRADETELVAAERPTGLFSRQLVLGDNLDLEQIKAEYDGGVLRLRIPVVVAKPQPRKISVTTTNRSGSSGEQAKITS